MAPFPEDSARSRVVRYVTDDPLHVDEVTRSVGMLVDTVTASLAVMEIIGLVRNVRGMNYMKMREAV